MNSFGLNMSIIMPCYRGEQYIENAIRLVGDEVGKFENQFELILVVDGILDRTYEKASDMQEDYKYLKVVGYEKNQGKGYAVRYGTKYCSGKYIVFLDSDMDYHPGSIKTLLACAVNNDANIVVGNRRDKGSIFVYPMIRKLASIGFNNYVNLVFPDLKISDTQAGIKLIERSSAEKIFKLLEGITLADGFIYDICLLVLARKLRMRIVESPCVFEMQSSTIGVGKKFVGTAFKMAKEVLELKNVIKGKILSIQ
jgi:glycosyltransferase involved in cell wall biosynthesis